MFTLKPYSLLIRNSYVTDCPVVLFANSGALAWNGEGLELWLPDNLCKRPVMATQGGLLGGPVARQTVTHVAYPLCQPPPLPLGLTTS